MPAGRKSIPISIKDAKGTRRKGRDPKDSAEVHSPEELTPPSWLPKKYWRYFELIRTAAKGVGLNSNTYSELAGLAAKRLYEFKKCETLINKHGDIIHGRTGMRNNPAIARQNECMRHLQSLLAEFGLTPSTVLKLGLNLKGKNEPEKGFGNL